MTQYTDLQQTAAELGCEDPLILSEFELHRFIRATSAQLIEVGESTIKPVMNVFSVYHIENSPVDIDDLVNMVDNVFENYCYHVDIEGKYYAVFHKKALLDKGYSIVKMNPSNPEHSHIMDTIIKQLTESNTIQ